MNKLMITLVDNDDNPVNQDYITVDLPNFYSNLLNKRFWLQVMNAIELLLRRNKTALFGKQ